MAIAMVVCRNPVTGISKRDRTYWAKTTEFVALNLEVMMNISMSSVSSS